MQREDAYDLLKMALGFLLIGLAVAALRYYLLLNGGRP